MKIAVTQAHIDAGEKQQCYRCPIALAIKDAVPLLAVEVAIHEARIGGVYCFLPHEARQFIRAFDEYGCLFVRPFEFDLGYLS